MPALQAEAQAILQVQQALAESIKLLNAAAPTDKIIALKSLDALAKVADGKATKIIIPYEIQSLAALAASLKEFVMNGEKDTEEAAVKTAARFAPNVNTTTGTAAPAK